MTLTMEQTVARINELARAAKQRDLTPEEIAERDQLRQVYIRSVRENLRAQLDNTYLVDEHGNKTPLRKK